MTIVFVVNHLPFFFSHRLNLGIAAKKSGFKVVIAAPDLTGCESWIEKNGFSFYAFPHPRNTLNPIALSIGCLRGLSLILKLKPNVLHLVSIQPILFCGLPARLLQILRCSKLKLILSISGVGSAFIGESFLKKIKINILQLLYKIIFSHAQATVIFQNEDDLNYFLKSNTVKKNKTLLIEGSGVDEKLFTPIHRELHSDSFKVAFIARILRDKGFFEFTESAAILRKKYPLIEFQVYGLIDPGNPSSVTKKELDELHEKKIIDYKGERKDIHEVLKKVDLVCLPSYREGLPKTLLEAAASGLPIVATDVPGCRSIAIHELNALTVPARDSAKLAHAIEKLYLDPKCCEKFGKEGRKLVLEKFTIEKITDAFLKLYIRS